MQRIKRLPKDWATSFCELTPPSGTEFCTQKTDPSARSF